MKEKSRRLLIFVIGCALLGSQVVWPVPGFADPTRPQTQKCEGALQASRSLYLAAQFLKSGGDPSVLHAKFRNRLMSLAAVETLDELMRPEVLDHVLEITYRALHPQEAEKVLKTQLSGVQSALRGDAIRGLEARMGNNRPASYDLRDMNRSWGGMLLPRYDQAFSDPSYLLDHFFTSLGTSGRWMSGSGMNRNGDSGFHIEEAFKSAWKALAPKNVSPPNEFTLTGSDALNLILESLKSPVAWGREFQSEILFFENLWFTSRGANTENHFRRYVHDDENVIPSPYTETWNSQDEAEIKRLKEFEDRALTWIRTKAAAAQKTKKVVRAIVMEPILGAGGVKFFRTEFLLKLRALCDELQILIVADEVLTGGGRTGEFFAYQNYPGFEPDVIAFGKGLQIAGIASVNRRNGCGICIPRVSNPTLNQNDEALLKVTRILVRLKEGNLIQNAKEVGEYFVSKLNKNKIPARGRGMLIFADPPYDLGIRGGMGRLMPHLTLTREDVDRLLEK